MTASIAQHPILWLLAAFLAGALVEWILEMFYFRQRLFEAEDRARRRSEELDSERFHHGRTQADLRARLGELDAALKGRTLAESLLQAARAKLTTAEAEALQAQEGWQAALVSGAERERERDTALRDLAGERSDRLGLQLRCETLRAEADTRDAALASLQNRLSQVLADAESAGHRLTQLDTERQTLATRVDQQDASLEAARRELVRVAEQGDQARADAAGARSRESAAATRVATLEQESATLMARLRDTETRADMAAKAAASVEQKLKARSEEVRQMSVQLGEATEELAALRGQTAQTRAQLEAAAATRASLERDLAARERELQQAQARSADAAASAAATAGAEASAELAELRESLAGERRAAASLRGKAEELEAELLAITRAHQEAVRQLESAEAAAPGPAAGSDDELAADLEAMTRERNELAAELAVLRAARAGGSPD